MFEGLSGIQIFFLIIANLIRVYELILFIRVIFSWVTMFNPSILSSKIFQAIYFITEPPLSFIRNYLPSRLGFLDLSVLWLFLLLELLYMGIIKTMTLL